MRPLVLTRERFATIRRVLLRRGPTTARDLERCHFILRWELDESITHGLLEMTVRKPSVGRPAKVIRLAENVSKSYPTKLLPAKWDVPARLSIRHERFVRALAVATPLVRSYYKAGYRPKSRAAARAGASRLARRAHVLAARLYACRTDRFFCRFPEDIASFGGYPWLALLQSLPVDPDSELRCRLAAGRNLAEAQTLISPCLDTDSVRLLR